MDWLNAKKYPNTKKNLVLDRLHEQNTKSSYVSERGCQEFTIWKKSDVSEEPMENRRCGRKMDVVQTITASIFITDDVHWSVPDWHSDTPPTPYSFVLSVFRSIEVRHSISVRWNLNGNYLEESIAEILDGIWISYYDIFDRWWIFWNDGVDLLELSICYKFLYKTSTTKYNNLIARESMVKAKLGVVLVGA